MYISFHSSVAIGILLLPLPLWVKVPLAILSHLVVDILGEHGLEKWRFKEFVLNGLLILGGALFGKLGFAISGIILGNLFDILDMRKIKTGNIFTGWFKDVVIHKPNRFGKLFYPPVLVNLTEEQTFDCNKMVVILTIFIMFLL